MSNRRGLATLALVATAVAVAAWLALAAAVIGGAYDHVVGDVPGASSDAGAEAQEGAAVDTGAEDDASTEPGEDEPAIADDAPAADPGSTPTEPSDPSVLSDPSDPSATPTAADPNAIVDWPDVPDVAALEPVTTTARFTVTVTDDGDALLLQTARAWAPALEGLLDEASERVGRALPRPPVAVVFARAYEARCPARGLASPGNEAPLLMVFVDEDTSAVQIRAVLAHEIVHHLTYDGAFVGDAVLTEGVANWGAGPHALAWQGFPSWPAAARAYLADGTYVSVADDTGQVPREGESCLARRDRVYNVRAAFVEWLVATYGRETVLAMPAREVPDPDDPDGEPLRVPDYAAATGHDLVALERRWLAELTADEVGGEAARDAEDRGAAAGEAIPGSDGPREAAPDVEDAGDGLRDDVGEAQP